MEEFAKRKASNTPYESLPTSADETQSPIDLAIMPFITSVVPP